jgi:DNA polymerase-3 subunit delta
MPVSSLKTLRDAIKHRSFDSAYCISGEDDYQKDDAVRQLIDAAVGSASRDFNLDIRRSADLDAESLQILLSTPPMMADRRVVVVRDFGALKKDTRKALDAYLQHPATDLTLILTCAAGAKPDSSITAAATQLEFDSLTDDRIPKWIAHRVGSELGMTISEPAVELLQAAVGNDLFQLANEIDKLASYMEGLGQEITEDAVSVIVGVRRGETAVDLMDAVADQNLGRALELIPHVLAQPKSSAVSIVMGLTTQMLAISWGRARLDEGIPKGRLGQEYFDLLRDTGAYAARSWGSAAAIWTRATDRWSREGLDYALDLLLEADAALKESKVSSDEQLLATLILSLCAAEKQYAAA